MLLLPVAIWGWRLLTHRHFDREALRVAFWVLATRAAAPASQAACRAPRAWPLPTGLGGVTGDALLRLPASLIGADRLLHAPGARRRLRRHHAWRRLLIASGVGLAREAVVEDIRGRRGRGRRGRDTVERESRPDVARADLRTPSSACARAHRLLLLAAIPARVDGPRARRACVRSSAASRIWRRRPVDRPEAR